MGRLLYVTFFGEFRGTHEQEHHLHESPAVMALPLIVLAVLSVAGGFLNVPHFWVVTSGWRAGFPQVIPVAKLHLDHHTETLLMGTATAVALIVLADYPGYYTAKKTICLWQIPHRPDLPGGLPTSFL
jgi:NADH-quinone oxidoreductase subunit L